MTAIPTRERRFSIKDLIILSTGVTAEQASFVDRPSALLPGHDNSNEAVELPNVVIYPRGGQDRKGTS